MTKRKNPPPPPKGQWGDGTQKPAGPPGQKAHANLLAARIVSKTAPPGDGEPPETGLRKMYRELRESDPKAFLQQLQKMEMEWAAFKVEEKGQRDNAIDLGAKRCLEAAERLLAEYDDKK